MAAAAAKDGACAPGSVRPARPPRASASPAQVRGEGRSPCTTAAPIIVACTVRKRRNAPTPAESRRYAQENGAAYRNSQSADRQPASTPARCRLRERIHIIAAPESSRSAAKEAAPAWPEPSARRVSSELEAKAQSVSAQTMIRRARCIGARYPTFLVI